jgi:tetratricopeptide (TPR) repeat protein
MAKHCDVCNKSYPDTEPHCPHCGAELAEPALAEEASHEPLLAESDDDSAVNLDEPVVADLASSSGSPAAPAELGGDASDVAWSELAVDASEADAPAKVDSPSDVDLLAHAAPDTHPAVPSDSAVRGEPFVAEVASGVDLPGPGVTETPPPTPASDSGSAVSGEAFVAEVASGEDLAGARAAKDESESSAVDLASLVSEPADEAEVAEVAESSDVRLAEEPVVTSESSPSPANLEMLATEPEVVAGSEEAVGGAAAPEKEGPDTQFLDDLAEVEAGSAVNLGEASRSPERSSSRDLIAEAVESGVDLDAKPADAAEEEAEAEAVVAEESDSAVDLAGEAAEVAEPAEASPSSGPEAVAERNVPPGSHHDIDLDAAAASDRVDLGAADDEEEEAEVAEEDDTELVGSGPDSSGVDLGGGAARPPKKPLGEPSSALDVEDAAADALAGSDSGAEAVAEDEEDEEAEEVSARSRKKAKEGEEEDEASALLAGDKEEAEASALLAGGEEKAEAEEEAAEEEGPRKKRPAAEEEEDEDEGKPKAPPRGKARSGVGCLLVGSLLGLLIGVGGALGLWAFGIEPPSGWKLAETKTPSHTGRAPTEQKPGPGPEAQPAANPARDLSNGEFAKVVTDLGSAPAATPEVQAQRGTARWMKYLQEQMGKNAPLKAEDEEVKQARDDLQAAAQKDIPEAVLSLGHLQEYTGRPGEALKTYQDGLTRFAAKPAWKQAFQAQIDRLESTSARPPEGDKPVPGALAPRLEDRDVAARALLGLLIAFQGDQPTPPAGDNPPAEAGPDFWAAVKASQNGDYKKALEDLEKARKAHDKLRFSRLRKAQNPISDPTEEIFLRSVREIEAYWKLQQYLGQQGLVARGGDPQKAIDALVKEKKDAIAQKDEALAKVKDQIKEATDKLMKENDKLKETVTTLQKDLDTAKKDLMTAKKESKDLSDKLATTDKELKTANAILKSVADRLEAAGVKDDDLTKGIDTLAAERAAADKTINAVVEKIALAHVKVTKKDVLKGLDRVVTTALVNDPKGELMASRDEIKRLGTVLAERRTPEQMVDVWLPIVADRTQKDVVAKAKEDADRVRSDDNAPPVARRKALAVLGFAQRNLGDLDAARTLLSEALAGPGPKAEWQTPVAAALKDLTDPTAHYLPRARALYEDGKNKEALDVLAEAAKLFPKEKDIVVLLPLRSLVQLELAREKGNGKIDANDALIAAARKDAQTAAAAGDAEGHYALGRLEEDLGHLAEAKTAYAKALDAHKDDDAAGARYRLALARVLKLQGEKPRLGRAGPMRSLPVADVRREPLLTLLLLTEIGMLPAGPDEDEATRLLKEVESARDGPDTFMLKAQALALRGLWTPAVKVYAAGLRGRIRRDYADGLADLIEHHPGLRRPSSMEPPNPLLAEGSYATGLRHYFAHKYSDAESAFVKAIEYDNQDARYFYFLGLSRLAQDKRSDAEADFQEGAQLERQNRPGREAVSTALERIQGTARQAVNRYRP